MKTMYSLHPSFAPSAKLPIASIHYPIAVHEGNQQTLNDEQLAAIAPLTGRCVVNSGAGTGKTTVLVARMLAIQEQFPGSHVLMLTFSRKAALELRDRIGSTPGCQVSTFHSICYHILQANGFKDFSVNTNEAARVIDQIKHLHKDGMRYDHIAILYRSSFAASALLEALLDKQLPFRCKSHTSLKAWTSPFREAVEIMRYALQPNDAKLFKPLLRALYIRQALMPEIRKLAKKNGCSLIHAATLLQLPFFQTEYVEKMDTAVSSMAQQPPADAVLSLLDAGYSQFVGQEKSDMLLAWTQELEEFPSIPALITHIDDLHDQLSAIRSQSSKAGDALQLMTIHASKGLEFDCVFLIGTADGILPSGKDDVDMDEERRLLYVAVTRAKHRLYVSYPARSSNSSNENKASRFLLDALSRI